MDINELIKEVEKESLRYSEEFKINRDSDWFLFNPKKIPYF